MSDTNNTHKTLTKDEIELYDRQIRLWGLDAQQKISNSNFLLINLGSIGQEIAKNLCISGIGNLTILDNHSINEDDLSSQFFISKDDLNKNRLDVVGKKLNDLNPRVNITLNNNTDFLFTLNEKSFWSKFNVIIATEITTFDNIKFINDWSRSLNIPFYLTNSLGLSTFCFIDLVQFNSNDKKLKSSIPTKLGRISKNKEIINVKIETDDDDKQYEYITTSHSYTSFPDLLDNLSFKHLHRRQLKKMSPLVPITLALLSSNNSENISFDELKQKSIEICEKSGISKTILTDESINKMISQKNIEFTPVSSIIGGAIAQDVINILGKRQGPLNNFLVFDGISLDMPIYEL